MCARKLPLASPTADRTRRIEKQILILAPPHREPNYYDKQDIVFKDIPCIKFITGELEASRKFLKDDCKNILEDNCERLYTTVLQLMMSLKALDYNLQGEECKEKI